MKCITMIALLLAMPVSHVKADQPEPNNKDLTMEEQRYHELMEADWSDVFFDSCTDNWEENWHLDGKEARITHSEEGMDFLAGPSAGEDASHAVLWTLESFDGDVKIEYEYTRLDEATRFVTILFIQATGSGEGPYDKDIMQWADRRSVPSMRTYFNHMNTYHISYAAFDNQNDDPEEDYIRARRYMPETDRGLEGTDLQPDVYTGTGLFAIGVPHNITVIKSGDTLFMQIVGPDQKRLCHWDTSPFPPIEEGRIGLRHMCTRAARYKDFRVSVK